MFSEYRHIWVAVGASNCIESAISMFDDLRHNGLKRKDLKIDALTIEAHEEHKEYLNQNPSCMREIMTGNSPLANDMKNNCKCKVCKNTLKDLACEV